MNGRRCVLAGGIIVAGWMATGCATIVRGSHQDLNVTSQPEALCVVIDGESYGATPFVASLKRNQEHVVRVQNDPYLPHEQTAVPVMDGLLFGNLLFGGLPGLIIDGITGAAYSLSVTTVHAYFPVRAQDVALREKPMCPISPAVMASRVEQAEQERIAQSWAESRRLHRETFAEW